MFPLNPYGANCNLQQKSFSPVIFTNVFSHQRFDSFCYIFCKNMTLSSFAAVICKRLRCVSMLTNSLISAYVLFFVFAL